MLGNLDLTVWSDAREAAIAAHNMAEMDAEQERVAAAMDAGAVFGDNDNEEG
jgi:hypothetical protein